MPHRIVLATAILVSLVLAAPAAAVIELKLTLQGMYQDSKAVLTGKVGRVSAENGLVVVEEPAAIKGSLSGADGAATTRFRLQVAGPEGLLKQVAAGQPVVLMVTDAGKGVALVHLADTWCVAHGVAGAEPPLFRLVQEHADARLAFPGRTAGLIRALADIRSGKRTLLNKIDQRFLTGLVRKLVQVQGRPTWVLAADFNSDKRMDLLVGGGQDVRLLVAADDGYRDGTGEWGLTDRKARIAAIGDLDGDGKPDLLLDQAILLNTGGKFTALKAELGLPDPAEVLAAAIVDVAGDQRPDVALILKTGQLVVLEQATKTGLDFRPPATATLWDATQTAYSAHFGDFGDDGRTCLLVVRASGVTRYRLSAAALSNRSEPATAPVGPASPGAATGPADQAAGARPPLADDYQRLTGQVLGRAQHGNAKGYRLAGAVALDANGDGRRDLLILSSGGNELLVNRGQGAFLVDADVTGGALDLTAREAGAMVFGLATSAALVAADLRGDQSDDLLVLDADGWVRCIDNTPRK